MPLIRAYEHVGIRVVEKARSVAFYERLGFREALDLPEYSANEMVNEHGVTINLIYNGVARDGNRNILQDEPVKYAGVTHPAFVVDDLGALLADLAQAGVAVTEGPLRIGTRRRVAFVRDPDGTVLEFDELVSEAEESK